MICNKCGKENANNLDFCAECGEPLKKEPSEYQQSANNSQDQILNKETKTESAEKKPLKKKILIAVLALILVGICTAFAFDTIHLHISPGTYAAKLFARTFPEISEEVMEAEEKIFGFNVKEQEELTAAVGMEIDIDSMMKIPFNPIKKLGFEAKSGISKKNNEMLLEAKSTLNDERLLSLNYYHDNKEFAVTVPELIDDYLTIPSKDFGKAWNKSYIGKKTGIEVGNDLDLSFSELFGKKTESIFTEESMDELKKRTFSLLKTVELKETDKEKVTVKGKLVKSKKAEFELDGKEVKSYALDVIKLIKKDKENKAFEKIKIEGKTLSKHFEEIEKLINDKVEFDNISLTTYEYRRKIVKLELEMDCEFVESEEEFEIKYVIELQGDDNAVINALAGEIEVSNGIGSVSVVFESEGDHMPKDNVFTDKTEIELLANGKELCKIINNSECNFKGKDLDGKLNLEVSGQTATISYGGECSNKDGFEVGIDKISISIPGENKMDFKGSINYAIYPEMKLKREKADGKVKLLEFTENELKEYFTSLEETTKVKEFIEKTKKLKFFKF